MEKKEPNILLVDDDENFIKTLSARIKLLGFNPLVASRGEEALSIAGEHRIECAILDLNMPDMDGLTAIERLKEIHPGTKTILLTGYGSEKVKRATEALNSYYFQKDQMEGLWSFLGRLQREFGMIIITPSASPDLRDAVSDGSETGILPDEIEIFAARKTLEKRRQTVAPHSFPFVFTHAGAVKLIGETPCMQELKKKIEKVAVLDCTVLIHGETGTGKELVAKAIHQMSPRSKNRFFAVNCGSFSMELLSNELFGHEKEAYTGARQCKKGIFEATSGGTILLDEIGDTPQPMQAQLLRVLQEKSVIRVGGTKEIPVDVRILAATNKSLKDMAESGEFRKDLYYRLNVFELNVPPLRERRDDLYPLCAYFLHRNKNEFGKEIEGIADDVMAVLMNYPFHGNVRELENLIERAVILCDGPVIQPHHLPERFQKQPVVNPTGKNNLMSLQELETQYIRRVLQATGNNKSKAAQILGINRASLWRKLKRITPTT